MYLSTASRDLSTLKLELTLLEKSVLGTPQKITLGTNTSGWTPGEHLEHLLKALRLNLRAIDRICAGKGDSSLSPPPIFARWVLLSGWIPSGREAPKVVMPSAEISGDALEELLKTARDELVGFEKQMPEVIGLSDRLLHPALGGLNARQWLRFATIHTRHHRKIVDGIVREASL